MQITLSEFLKLCETTKNWHYSSAFVADDNEYPDLGDPGSLEYTIYAEASINIPGGQIIIRSRVCCYVDIEGKKATVTFVDTWEDRLKFDAPLGNFFWPRFEDEDLVIIDERGEDQQPIDCTSLSARGGVFYHALSDSAVNAICTTLEKASRIFDGEIRHDRNYTNYEWSGLGGLPVRTS